MNQLSYLGFQSVSRRSRAGSQSALTTSASRHGSQSVAQPAPHSVPGDVFSPRQQPVPHHEIPLGDPPENQTAVLPSSFMTHPNEAGQWESFARHHSQSASATGSKDAADYRNHALSRQQIHRRQSCSGTQATEKDEKAAYLPLSRTTDRVLRILLDGDLSRLRAESVAEDLGISCTTLRRRLRNDHTSYQFLLDRARQYRCESRLRERWLPGKCLADELGYLEVNSFYRAFRRWTGLSYSDYRQMYH